jgi:NADPH:quinone reductase
MEEPHYRVVHVKRFGDPDGLEVVDAGLPTAGRDEVRVRVLASGLEYTDVLIRRHLYPQTAARQPPFVLDGCRSRSEVRAKSSAEAAGCPVW